MSDYIMGLRTIVGHRPLLQVGASVIVEDSQGRILLQLRSETIVGVMQAVPLNWMKLWKMRLKESCLKKQA